MKLLQSKFQLSHQVLMIALHIQLYWLARPLASSLILIIWHNMKVSYVFINDIYLEIYFTHRREDISRLSLPANVKLTCSSPTGKKKMRTCSSFLSIPPETAEREAAGSTDKTLLTTNRGQQPLGSDARHHQQAKTREKRPIGIESFHDN